MFLIKQTESYSLNRSLECLVYQVFNLHFLSSSLSILVLKRSTTVHLGSKLYVFVYAISLSRNNMLCSLACTLKIKKLSESENLHMNIGRLIDTFVCDSHFYLTCNIENTSTST